MFLIESVGTTHPVWGHSAECFIDHWHHWDLAFSQLLYFLVFFPHPPWSLSSSAVYHLDLEVPFLVLLSSIIFGGVSHHSCETGGAHRILVYKTFVPLHVDNKTQPAVFGSKAFKHIGSKSGIAVCFKPRTGITQTLAIAVVLEDKLWVLYFRTELAHREFWNNN